MALFLLHCTGDGGRDGGGGGGGEDGASLPSRLTFQWLTPLLRGGFRRQVQVEDFPEVI